MTRILGLVAAILFVTFAGLPRDGATDRMVGGICNKGKCKGNISGPCMGGSVCANYNYTQCDSVDNGKLNCGASFDDGCTEHDSSCLNATQCFCK